jgi:3'5'-cyclic nucleotide phosphodiesterase
LTRVCYYCCCDTAAADANYSLLLAAVMHDYRHPGVNNNYLVKRQDPLAITYNDQSVLENFHASESFKVMLDPKFAILEHWGNEDLRVSSSS